MKTTILKITFLTALSLWLSAAAALEQQVCEDRLKSVDERIASGKYSGQNVQIAQQMRDSIMQSCGFLDEATFGQMMEGFEQLLPTRSAAERQAYEETKRAESNAQRETQRAELKVKRAERARADAERQEREAQKPPVPAVLKQLPTGKTTMGRFVDRDDAMLLLRIHDWDHFNGSARVLYETYPAPRQKNSPNAKKHYYVLKVDAGSGVTQHHIAEMPPSRSIAVARLRYGHDEVIFQWPTPPGPGSTLERWSISKGESLSSITAPTLPWSGHQWTDANHFRLTTNDGNLFFVGHRPVARGDETALEWLKASPDGEIIGQGILQSDTESIGSNAWFRTRDGGAALVINVQNFEDERGIKSELETPLVHNVAGVELKGVVGYETRLLTIDKNGKNAGQSAALERRFIWHGMDKLGQLKSIDANREASELTSRDGVRYGETNSVRSYGASGRNVIAAVGDGYGVLLSASALGSEQPHAKGDWLFDYSTDGDVRKTYLETAAKHLGAAFRMITATDNDSVYLYTGGGENGAHVVQLDEDREFVAYGKLSMSSKTRPRGMLADRKGVWVFGDARTGADGQLSKVWLERINFE